jgi:hypothetical protein
MDEAAHSVKQVVRQGKLCNCSAICLGQISHWWINGQGERIWHDGRYYTRSSSHAPAIFRSFSVKEFEFAGAAGRATKAH